MKGRERDASVKHEHPGCLRMELEVDITARELEKLMVKITKYF